MGENGGVVPSDASAEVGTLTSALGADAEGGGEGGCVAAKCCAGLVSASDGVAAVALASAVSILVVVCGLRMECKEGALV